MAEYQGKLAIFGQKSASRSEEVGRRGKGRGSPENLKNQGGVFWEFSISGGWGGGYFGNTPNAHP